MTQTQPVILWDFDGTLAMRPGLWSATLMQILDEYEPDHNVDIEQIRPYLREGFPWHQPEQPHHNLSVPNAWWAHVESILARAYQGVGVDGARARILAQLAHERYIDSKGFILYDDTIPALEYLSERGWKHVILSNHVPELPEIVRGLDLLPHISLCITSASIGYEKPNPEAFRIALNRAGNPERAWVIGDNPDVDVRGAEAIGLPAILVRSSRGENMKYYAHNLKEIGSIIEATSPPERP